MQKKTRRYKIRRSTSGLIIGISQTVSARLFRLVLRLLGGFTVKNTVHFEPGVTYLFAANHQSRIDPFAVFATLSLVENFRIAPVRFMTARGIYYSGVWLLLKLCGCYPTSDREATIQRSVAYLRAGYNLFIFPEGKRVPQAASVAKPGVALILEEVRTPVQLVLVHLQWQRVGRWGRRFAVSLALANPEVQRGSANTIMEAVYKV